MKKRRPPSKAIQNAGKNESPQGGNGNAPEATANYNHAREEVRATIVKALADIVPPQKVDTAAERLLVTVQQQARRIVRTYSGPMPSPDWAEAYERLLPGSIERMFEMAERDQLAVIESHNQKVGRDDRYRLWALAGGFAAFLLLVGAVIWLALEGRENAALGLCGVGAAGVVLAFVNARFSSNGESD